MDIESTGNYELVLTRSVLTQYRTPEHIEVADGRLAEKIYVNMVQWIGQESKTYPSNTYKASMTLYNPDRQVIYQDTITR